jgi:serine/threonine protein kinase
VQIAHGLAPAHDKGIVHRVLKPENLFITKDGRVKVLDFGLARLGTLWDASGDEATVTLKTDPGKVMGTAGYMSPEQLRGKTVDHRSIWTRRGSHGPRMCSWQTNSSGDDACSRREGVYGRPQVRGMGGSGTGSPIIHHGDTEAQMKQS